MLKSVCDCFADSSSLYLVLEYICGGEFFTHLREQVMLELDCAKFYAAQVASIFAYLHEKVSQNHASQRV